jgi:hypothetical protein
MTRWRRRRVSRSRLTPRTTSGSTVWVTAGRARRRQDHDCLRPKDLHGAPTITWGSMGANGSSAPLKLAILNHADQLPDRGRTGGSHHVFPHRGDAPARRVLPQIRLLCAACRDDVAIPREAPSRQRSASSAAHRPGRLLTLRNYRWLGSRFPSGRPSGRDAHKVVAGSQRITVPAMLTINDAACSWPVTRNTRMHPWLLATRQPPPSTGTNDDLRTAPTVRRRQVYGPGGRLPPGRVRPPWAGTCRSQGPRGTTCARSDTCQVAEPQSFASFSAGLESTCVRRLRAPCTHPTPRSHTDGPRASACTLMIAARIAP